MNDSMQTTLTSVCPICYSDTSSSHHIKPRSEGGKDDPRNKVGLCRRCHDIVEMIYGETGMEYSPSLVYHIQREFDLGEPIQKFPRRPKLRHSSPRHKSTYRFRGPVVKREDFPKIGTCVLCGREFERTRSNQATCQRCPAEQDKSPFVILAWTTETYLRDSKKERVYISTRGRLFKIKEGILCSTKYAHIPQRCLRNKTALVAFLESMKIEGARRQYIW